jgi:site-specific DNA-methyltransferase (adenine-specific)
VIVASKGRFDRALSYRERERKKLPHKGLLKSDDFMEYTTDVWEMPPESASRVGHPAPFPVELPERLIRLYTYEGDLVLDPFMGSGTTAVAAVKTERHFAGYDTDPAYVERATSRVRDERARRASDGVSVEPPASLPPADRDGDFQARAVREGHAAKRIAKELLEQCRFTDIKSNVRFRGGVEVNFRARDAVGRTWLFDVSGGFTSSRPGLKRTDTLWKALGKAAVLHATGAEGQLILLTTDLPESGSAGDTALRAVRGQGKPIRDVIRMLDRSDLQRLKGYQAGGT